MARVPGSFSFTINNQPREKRKTREEFMFGTDPIVGYRLWSIGTRDLGNVGDMLALLADAHDAGAANPYRWALEATRQPLLRAIFTGTAWLPGVHEATCVHNQHAAPALQCECGFWALRDEEQLAPAFNMYAPDAWGTVNMWGRFCEFDKGFRAQYAYPSAVTLLRDDPALADTLSRTYGVPVTCGGEPVAVAKAREEQKLARGDDGLYLYGSLDPTQYTKWLLSSPALKPLKGV